MQASLRDLLLTRRGIAFITSSGTPLLEKHVRAVEVELAEVGYVLSTRLRTRLLACSLDELTEFRSWACARLLAHLGGDRRHEPLFRRFPDDIPDDTEALWWTKVLSHFLQAEGQPCLFCRRMGTTHVLRPCRHVICDQCFDGTNYSACPICEHHVDRSLPFFREVPERSKPSETVTFKLLDLGDDFEAEVKAFFVSLCERKQALSKDDREALQVILREMKSNVLTWLPEAIPVRENIAIIFGTLFQECVPSDVLPHAKRHMTTATDVLRFISVWSGTDGSLLPEVIFKEVKQPTDPNGFWAQITKALNVSPTWPPSKTITIPMRVNRFKVARIPRSLRRTLLSMLDSLKFDRLCEDMLRHRSFWVWVGQFLHPGEYESRFPNATRAFRIVRKKAPDGTRAPAYRGWYSRLEERAAQSDAKGMVALLTERPGEFARRLDHTLRVAGNDRIVVEQVLGAFTERSPAYATSVLLTLHSMLPTRTEKARIRVYWPKGRVAMGALSSDDRTTLEKEVIESAISAIDAELLNRFSAKPLFENCLVDELLDTIIVPFNERTASSSAVSLPRGSRVPVSAGKLTRLFLHWCQPKKGGQASDLDLSVAFYDQQWHYLGVCSYYALNCILEGEVVAKSAGDLRDAPWPDGATEFIDLYRDKALAAGVRYAVMIVNNYAGMPFSLLDRGFAGLMLRDDPSGWYFDPRNVELKFSIEGENGIFMPLVLDVQECMIHWLDMHARGELEMNNVEKSKAAIFRVCPSLMEYFSSGIRASMYDLGLLHAAARCKNVYLRGNANRLFVRRIDEDSSSFYNRLVSGQPNESSAKLPSSDSPPLMALLYRGNLELPDGSGTFVLFRESVNPSMTASDLLS
jgi:hypothetical protein